MLNTNVSKDIIDICVDDESLAKYTLFDIGFCKHKLRKHLLIDISSGYESSFRILDIKKIVKYYCLLIEPVYKFKKIIFTGAIFKVIESKGFRYAFKQLKNHFYCKFRDLTLLSQSVLPKEYSFLTTLIATYKRSDIQLIYSHIGYTKDNIYVATIYSYMLGQIQAHIVIDKNSIAFVHRKHIDPRICLNYNKNIGTIKNNTSFMEGVSNDVINYIFDNNKQKFCRLESCINSIGVGLRNSFGHSLINFSSYLNLLNYPKIRKNIDSILISNSDFLNLQECSFMNKFKNIYLDLNSKEFNYISIGRKRLLTLETKLPSLRALFDEYLKGSKINISEKSNFSIYINLDQRKGKRYIANLKEICEELVKYDNPKIKIFLDKYTSRKYKSYNNKKLETSIPKDILKIFKNSNYINIDGMTLRDKFRILSKNNFLLALSSLGSSAMIPIYLLNTHLLTYANKNEIDELLNNRHYWHIGPLCHDERISELIEFIDSKSNKEGLSVVVNSFSSAIRRKMFTFKE